MGTGVKAVVARADMSSTTSRYIRNQQRPQLSRVQAQLFVLGYPTPIRLLSLPRPYCPPHRAHAQRASGAPLMVNTNIPASSRASRHGRASTSSRPSWPSRTATSTAGHRRLLRVRRRL